jgi:hypothetical protein
MPIRIAMAPAPNFLNALYRFSSQRDTMTENAKTKKMATVLVTINAIGKELVKG